jgi:Ca-activated chloride channel family protein
VVDLPPAGDGVIRLDHPLAIWLLPLGALLCGLVLRRSLVDVPALRRWLGLVLRLCFVAALVLAIASPSAERPPLGRSVVALVDLSASVDADSLKPALAHLAEVRRARGSDDRLAVVGFGGRAHRAMLADDASAGDPLTLPRAAEIDDQATDLEAALRLGEGLVSPGRSPSLIVYSDGNETTGSALAAVPALRRRGLPVDVVPIRKGDRPEVLVRSLTLPRDVRAGARFEITAELESTRPQKLIATLYRDDFVNPLDGRKELELPAGRTTVRWKSEVPQGGLARYSVRLSGGLADTSPHNNRADAVAAVRGNPRVLLIEGGAGSHALADALAKEHIDVEVRGPSALPAAPEALQPFDLLALSDVQAGAVGPAQAQAIERYVEGGGGFVFLGGENVTDGWSGTRLEKLLPVRFDKPRQRDEAQLGLILCIDRSGSMEAEGRLELAKEAAKATAELLGPDDLIGVIAFDSTAQSIVRLQRAANRLRITTDISRLRPGGGTAILPPLREAFSQLDAARAKVKHVILLTDGQASYDGIPELVKEMVEHKITVSAVGVGGEADKSLLTTIAQRGQGRFYFTRDADQVPKIFLKETSEVARRSLVEEPTRVQVIRAAELFAGTGIEAAPPLGGYVTVRAKPGGEVLLSSSRGDPLLARRRDGLGQVAVWASDAKNRWASSWLPWPGFSRFFAQLVRSTMRPPLAGAGVYPTEVTLDPPRAQVSVDATSPDDRFVSGLSGEVQLGPIDPAAPRTARVPLVETAPGRYQATLRPEGTEPQLVQTILRRDGAEVSRSVQAISPPRALEHLALPPDLERLDALRTATGGRLDPSPDQVFAAIPGASAETSRRPLWAPALWAALCLLILDLAARRWPSRTASRLTAREVTR